MGGLIFMQSELTERDLKKLEYIKKCAHELDVLIDIYCIESREKSLALTKLEECVMWINACLEKNPS